MAVGKMALWNVAQAEKASLMDQIKYPLYIFRKLIEN